MNFTREPIIETIITPRDGCRLVIRSSKQGSEEEFTVDAVEVISFGPALFFRSLEKPRPFLVPVHDYEVIEVKESKVVLKNASYEKTIKIGGGREGAFRKEEDESVLPAALEEEASPEREPQQAGERKRDRHRRRRHEKREEPKPRVDEKKDEAPKELPVFELIPPPTTLISDTIHRYKEQQSVESAPPKIVEDDSNSISRVASPEQQPLTTSFAPLNSWNNFLP